MTDLDAAVAAAFDDLGVPRAQETSTDVAADESKAKPAAKQKPARSPQSGEAGKISKAEARTLSEQADKIKRLERRLKRVGEERNAFERAASEAKERLRKAKRDTHVPLPARNTPAPKPVLLSFVHPKDRDLHIQLQGDIVMVALINHFAVTSAPLKSIEDHKVGLHEAAVTMLRGLDEWAWVEEHIETCARQWRCLNRVPLVHDYVMDNRVAKLFEVTHGIATLEEAKNKMADLPGVGAKTQEKIAEAWAAYEADKAKVLKQSVTNLAKQAAGKPTKGKRKKQSKNAGAKGPQIKGVKYV